MSEAKPLSQADAMDQLARRYAELELQIQKRSWELEEALHVAEEAARDKANLLAVMSHELRNPLHAILGIAQLLERSRLADDQRRQVGTIRECGDALLHLINDILDFSKLEAGKLQLATEDFEIEALVRQLESMFSVLANQRGIALRFSIDERVPRRLKGDDGRLKQVLVNLISNALKFTERGGVSVRCELAGEGIRETIASVRWLVTDTGIGIAPERLPALFQPYVQASRNTSRQYGGTGLGLAICKRLADAMGGRIEVGSVPGKGSKFSVTVPLAVPQDTAPAFANTMLMMQLTNLQGEAQLRPLRVLIVDDDRLNQMVAHTFVAEFGAQADEASDGFEAVERLQASEVEPFDLVLLDMMMPGIDGPGTARLIRELPLTQQPRIVAVTANAAAEDAALCRSAGMDDVLVKPYSREDLFAKLEQAVATRRTS